MKFEESDQLSRVVVTGGAGALGRAVIEQFLAAGYQTISLDIATGTQTLQQDQEQEGLYLLNVDVTNAGAVEQAVRNIEETLGGIDALIHCAGGFRWTHTDKIGDADLDFLIDLNLRSTALMLRAVLPGFKSRNFGRVVLISSKSTLKPGAGEGPYTATKAGVNALTLAVAEEVKDFDININAVQPTIIDTPANRQEMPDADYSKWVKRPELARIIFALTQPLTNPIHGALIPVSGRM